MNLETGRALWAMLHAYAHTYPDAPTPVDVERATAWLGHFDSAVAAASTGCNCRKHWQAITTQQPPDLTSRTAFYWWSVMVHNSVNVRLGKPTQLVNVKDQARRAKD